MKECPACGTCGDDAEILCPEDGRPLEASLEGSRIIDGTYVLERRLGSGGMGAVYRARHKDLQKIFALKIIRLRHLRSRDYLDRFRIEARALGKLQHPHIVQVTDYGIDSRAGDLPYLVTEYLEGATLDRVLSERECVPAAEALAIAESLAAAIDYAHGRGIFHRDLKPQNVFLTGDPSESRVKILDFGLARIAEDHALRDASETPLPAPAAGVAGSPEPPSDTPTIPGSPDGATLDLPSGSRASLTQPGSVMGTPGYIAPEIGRGEEAGPAADIYSFGVLVYEMLVGRLPSEAGRGPALLRSQACPPVPPELEAVLAASLDPDPRLRPPTATDFVRRLKRAHASACHRMWRAREAPRRFGLAAGLTAILLLLFGGLRNLPLVRSAEDSLADLRLRLLPARSPDARLVLVSIDEATLQADPALLSNRADEMGERLQGVLDQRPLGMGIDFLLPERWNQSRAFATFVLRNQDRLVLAGYAAQDGTALGSELFRGLIMAALGSQERVESLLGFVNLAADEDGRIRKSSLGFKRADGSWAASMPARAFRLVTGRNVLSPPGPSTFRIDFSIDPRGYRRVSWKDLPRLLAEQPGFFRDRFVFVGGEYEGSQDYHRIPGRSADSADTVSGLTLQALALNTLLQDRPIRDAPWGMAALLLGLAAMAASFDLLIRPAVTRSLVIWAGIMAAYGALSAALAFGWRLLLPVALPLSLLAFGLLAALAWRRRLTFVAKDGSGT